MRSGGAGVDRWACGAGLIAVAPLGHVPVRVPADDPRCEIGAYITNGKELREVTERKPQTILAEDVKTGTRWSMEYPRIVENWTLVRGPAPEYRCPDFMEAA